MAQWKEPPDSLDFFPTQPFATRQFIEHALAPLGLYRRDHIVWEPSCGEGHMARVLCEYFDTVHASDIFDYGAGYPVFDFLSLEPGQLGAGLPLPFGPVDLIIGNPPFGPATNPRIVRFILTALQHARLGVAMFGRIQMLEGIKRFERVWRPWRRHVVFAQHVERVPLFKGRLEESEGSATAYGWIVIRKDKTFPETLPGFQVTAIPTMFIPPCRKALERPGDYD